MAVCQACYGTGSEKLWRKYGPTFRACPECGGSGIEHCCEGLREQPATRAADSGGADGRKSYTSELSCLLV